MQGRISPELRTLTLAILGAFLGFVYWIIAQLSPAFEQSTEGFTRPLVEVLLLFGIGFIVYAIGWWLVAGFSSKRFAVGVMTRSGLIELSVIFVFAVLFRVIMVTSTPIQEIDLYRYVWDGAAVANQLDPYRYGPATVLDAVRDPKLEQNRPGLKPYCAIIDERPGMYDILSVVHFGHYTSPYPPTSQMVFGATVALAPKDATEKDYLNYIKAALVGFDLLTGIVIVLLLIRLGMSASLSLGYFWCPLVIKEIANGGHLDSITNFFCVLAIYFLVRALWPRQQYVDEDKPPATEVPPLQNSPIYSSRFSWLFAALSSAALAAAIAAKVYPVVLVPIWIIALFRRSSIVTAISALLVFIALGYLFMFPLLRHLEVGQTWLGIEKADFAELIDSDQSGIEAFSKYWEMNDFLFMVVVENLKPDTPKLANAENNNEQANQPPPPWFRFTPNSFRKHVIDQAEPHFVDKASGENYRPSNIAFFTTRYLTTAVLALLVIGTCALMLWQHHDPRRWLEFCFLTLAWFWLLSPTQNPWYWTWAIPLIMFARGRTWFFVSGATLIYYLRFWFKYHANNRSAIDVVREDFGDWKFFDWLFPFAEKYDYQGTLFFDFYLPIIQFAPIVVCLLIGWILGRVFQAIRNRFSSVAKTDDLKG